ncbi:MAG TPA: hypothetical protein VFP58_14330 [Candidatus Eisenbacteria bacterium]|nr:hypothetical protein [Candidatus Eisenbacteria bacterium]
MSPHLANGLRAAAWRGVARSDAPDEERKDTSKLRAGTAASFRRAFLIIAAWLIALLLVPIVFFQLA